MTDVTLLDADEEIKISEVYDAIGNGDRGVVVRSKDRSLFVVDFKNSFVREMLTAQLVDSLLQNGALPEINNRLERIAEGQGRFVDWEDEVLED